jgi:L-malate glycosyltransferase
VLIHHFSIGSRASRTAYALPGRMMLVYHNITPPEYFVGVHKDLVRLCFRGRRELTAYIERCDLALGDSEYNRQELEALGFGRTGVLPVVPDFSHLDGAPDARIAADFDDEWTNVMFVGRVIPNKKFDTLVRAFHVYRTRHNPRSRLLLVGSYSGFERYLAMVQDLIARLGTPDVHFLGHVSNEELSALYDVADLFLCASAHEGFCVPIVEAFYKRVPVLAYASTAVPATMDGGGVLYDTTDPFEIARLMEAVLDDPHLEDAVLQSQDAALDRLRRRDFSSTLVGFVDQVAAAPPRPAPDVAWDFWAQFDQFERLEELRQFRPALFQALPAGGEPR